MKRMLSILVMLSWLCSFALAEIITIDLATATEAELRTARDAIDTRIHEIHLASAPTMNESYIIHGKGIEILTDVELKSPLSRFNVHSKGEVAVSCYNGDEQLFISDYVVGVQTIPMIIVEADEDWYIDFSPVGTMDSLDISGNGSYTSDLFVTSPPTFATISLFKTAGLMEYTSISLYYVDKDGNVGLGDYVMYNVLAPKCIDYVIKPQKDAIAWFWTIDCSDNIQWTITAK